MPDPQPPISPWTMTPARITLLALGVLAVIMIVGTLMGGLVNYQVLSEAASSPAASSHAN
jgi:hypothetical protein